MGSRTPTVAAIAILVLQGSALMAQDVNDFELQKMTLRFANATNTFRLDAAGDLAEALKTWTAIPVQERWEKEVTPYFEGQEVHWLDFFSSAIILIGRVQANQAVIGFYNPWIDGMVLTGWTCTGDATITMEEFAIVSGESWRGAAIDETCLLSEWERATSRLPNALKGTYTRTIQIFNEEYALAAPYQLLSEAIGERLQGPEIELTPLKYRMINRMAMFRDYLDPEAQTPEAAEVLVAVKRAMEVLSQDDPEVLMTAVVAEHQDKELVETIFTLPLDLREELAPNFLLHRPEGAITALVDPAHPRWFILVSFLVKDGEVRIDSMEPYDFEVLEILEEEGK